MSHEAVTRYWCDICGRTADVPVPEGKAPEDAPLPSGWQNLDGPATLTAPGRFDENYLETCRDCTEAVVLAIWNLRAERRACVETAAGDPPRHKREGTDGE